MTPLPRRLGVEQPIGFFGGFERPGVRKEPVDVEHEAVLEAVQARLDRNPAKMRERRQTVEHPFVR